MISRAALRLRAAADTMPSARRTSPAAIAALQRVRYTGITTKSSAALRTHTTDLPSATAERLPGPATDARRSFKELELDGLVYVVTGGGRGLGLAQAEIIAEAGGIAYCLDIPVIPHTDFHEAQERLANFGVSLKYRQVDVKDADEVDNVISAIADKHHRIDGLVAAAGVQYESPALDFPLGKIQHVMDVNVHGVFFCARSVARQMIKYNTPGAMVLVASMSAQIANKNMVTSIYNASKAAVVQLAKNLAMEWSKITEVDGKMQGIRVNCLSPGNILTPMLQAHIDEDPTLKKKLEDGNMMGRISKTSDYTTMTLVMLSLCNGFMTGSNVVIDGGYTSW